MEIILHLALGFLLSFIGSLPFGVINMTVADVSIKRGMKAALILGAGAAFVEFFQSLIAIKFANLFIENEIIAFALNVIALIVFLSFAIYYLFLAKAETPKEIKTEKKGMPDFFIGMLVSSSNVLVFPYWILYSSYLMSNGWMRAENFFVILFSLGVAIGGMALFALYAKLGRIIVERGSRILLYINKFIGIVFLFFGLFQIYKFIQ